VTQRLTIISDIGGPAVVEGGGGRNQSNESTVGVGDDPRVVVEVLEAAVMGPTSDKNLEPNF
jgi:hypothetical protein